MSLLVALGATGIASRLLDKPEVLAVAIGIITALIMALVTSSKLNITEREIVYSSLFSHAIIPLGELASVSAKPGGGIIPGRSLGFLRKRGLQPSHTSIRIGLFSWPHAAKWITAANTAIQSAQVTINQGGGQAA